MLRIVKGTHCDTLGYFVKVYLFAVWSLISFKRIYGSRLDQKISSLGSVILFSGDPKWTFRRSAGFVGSYSYRVKVIKIALQFLLSPQFVGAVCCVSCVTRSNTGGHSTQKSLHTRHKTQHTTHNTLYYTLHTGAVCCVSCVDRSNTGGRWRGWGAPVD